MLVFSYLSFTLLFLLMIPVVTVFVQVIFASIYKKEPVSSKNAEGRVPLAIIMPAHNESLVIAESIESIQSQLTAVDSFVVVADNCTDDTAVVAKALNVSVIERFNEEQRGKGYALDFGLQYIKAKTSAKVVIVIDADCKVEENSVAMLVDACARTKRPVQALYLMGAKEGELSFKAKISSFAWIVKNKVRPLGFLVLGLPCQLMGTGMAFLITDLNKVNLASGHIVEDMKLGADLARIGKPPLFLPEAIVTSTFPPSDAATKTQRLRWEHGHLSVILSEFPRLFLEALKNKNLRMLGLALDLLVPPLAMLILLSLVALVLSVIISNKHLVLMTLSLIACLLVALFLAWFKFGRSVISFKQLCYAPIYVLMKIPLYIKFFLDRQSEWVRSKRD